MVGNNSTIGIGITMYLRDQFSGPSRRIKANAADMYNEIRRQSEATARQQRNMYAGLTMAGIMAMRGIASMVKTGADFNYTMTGVGTVVDATADQFENLKQKSLETGQETIFTSKEVAEGMRFMAMAGQKYGEIMTNITPASNLAAATMTALGGKGGAADIMTNVLRGFNLEASRSTEIADKLAKIALNSNTNLVQLGDAFKYSAATARDLGYTVDEVGAGIAMLGNAGLQGSTAGTAMENMMRYVTMTTGKYGTAKQRDALGMLGLKGSDLRDSAGNMKHLGELLGMIANRIEGMGTGDKQDVLLKIFGVRGKRGGSAIIANMKKYNQYLEMIGDSTGYANDKAGDMMDTLQGDMFKIVNAWENFKIAWSDALEPLVRIVLKAGTAIVKMVTGLMKIPVVGKYIPILITGFILLRTVLWGIRTVVAGMATLLLKNNMAQTSLFKNGIMGWKNMTWSARAYANELLRINAAQQGGMIGTVVAGAGGRKYRQNPGGGTTRVPNSTPAGNVFIPGGAGFGSGSATNKSAKTVTKLLPKIGAGLSTIGKVAGRFLPYLGWIILATDLLSSLKDDKDKDDIEDFNRKKPLMYKPAEEMLAGLFAYQAHLQQKKDASFGSMSSEEFMSVMDNNRTPASPRANRALAQLTVFTGDKRLVKQVIEENTNRTISELELQ